MPSIVEYIDYRSLAELFEIYLRTFVQQSPIVSACGCQIHCYEHHLVHIVKLYGPHQARVDFRREKDAILQTTDGFGEYQHEARRGTRMLAFLETLRNPDHVIRSGKLKTADRAFIKMYDCSQYPCMVVLAVKDGD